jgi:adenine-specific DNA-methyltransferase
MVVETSNFQNNTNEQILFIFEEELLKNIKKEFHSKIREGKPLKSDFLSVKGDPEPYTRKIIESQIKKFLPDIDLHSEIHKTTSLGNLRKPDGFIASKDIKINNNILIEWEPYNEDLRAKREHGINQAKLWISDINIGNKNDALVSNGKDWIFISAREIKNEIRVIERDLTIKEALKLMENVYKAEKVYEPPIEEALDITQKFYNWYVSLMHGGEYYDKENKKQIISKEDCLINNVLNASSKRQKEDFIRLNFTRLIFIRILTEYGIIREDILNYLKNTEPEDFYNRINQLYFESLNTPLNVRDNIPNAYKSIPFLNGGLFRKNEIDLKGIKLRRTSFVDVIQFLRTFHFKKEYERLEGRYVVDNTIDPEILGHILEKSIEDRKKSGVYYTPQIITEFMSNEIIKNYLKKRIIEFLKEKKDFQWKYIEKFSDIYELHKIALKKIYHEIIRPLKICDPAVGSGAFLLNCGNILYNIHKKFQTKLGFLISDYEIKKKIIQDNLYGVDIKDAAVDICKLRLWLWIIQKQTQEPLPNIEFNIRKGNSLLGYTNSETIKVDMKDITSWETKGNLSEIFEERNELINKYYNIQDYSEEINIKKEIENLTNIFESKLNQAILNELNKEKIWLKIEDIDKLNFFHWIMEFSEVFEFKNGFDIIIGNPPYFRVTSSPKTEQKVLGKLGILKNYHHGQGDIYYDFIVRCFELLRDGGQFIFITSRYWLESAYSNYLKKFLKEKVRILKILDFREQIIFKGVEIHNSILYYDKENPNKNDYTFKVYILKDDHLNRTGRENVSDYLDYVGDYKIDEWKENENWAFVPKRQKELFLKIKNIPTKLHMDYNCNQYSNCFRKKHKKYLIFKNKLKDVPEVYLKKYLKMGDVKKYSPDYSELKYCLVIHNKKLDLRNQKLQKFLLNLEISDEDLYEIKDESEKNIDKFNDLIYIGYRIPRLDFNFIYVNDKTRIDNTYFVTKKKTTAFSLKYLTTVLNSDLMKYYIDIVGKKKENEIEIGSNFLKNLPIIVKRASLTKDQIECVIELENLAKNIIELEQNNLNIEKDEQILNNLIYKLYGISEDEQNLITDYLNDLKFKLYY